MARNLEGVEYAVKNDLIERILGETRGMILYQEQIIRFAEEMCGFSPAEAIAVFKAMSRRQVSIAGGELWHWDDGTNRTIEEKWLADTESNGFSHEVARLVLDEMIKHAPCAYCKAHMLVMARLMIQVGWLRVHYPRECGAMLSELTCGQ